MYISHSFVIWSIKNSTWIFYNLFLLICFNFGNAGVVIYDGNFDIEEFSDLEISFTDPIPKNGIQGAIVAADPLHACVDISKPPVVNRSLNWFVLISGNLCDYERKVISSKLAGYSVAVIYNFRGRDEHSYGSFLPHFSHYSNISAVLIRTANGIKIKERYLYSINDRYRVFIYPNSSFNILTFLLLFAIVAGLFVVIMLAFTVVRFIQQSRTAYPRRLSSRHLRQLQTLRYQKGDRYETCPICLEDYKDKDKLRLLPCAHGYHAKCIDPWLTNNRRTCPVCKQKVILSGEYNAFDSDTVAAFETTPLLHNTNERNPTHGTFNSPVIDQISSANPLPSTASANSESMPSTSNFPARNQPSQNVCDTLHKFS